MNSILYFTVRKTVVQGRFAEFIHVVGDTTSEDSNQHQRFKIRSVVTVALVRSSEVAEAWHDD